MDFEELLFLAKMSDENAIGKILEMYHTLLIKSALVNGIFDEDLYQELIIEVLKCIKYFKQ